MTAQIKKLQKGFTLIELLVVIGILAILLAITLIAINPARQFQQSNDTKRRSDVNAILNAVDQYLADTGNNGQLPLGIDGTVKTIGAPADTTHVDLCAQLVTKYIAALPSDPTTGSPTTQIPVPCPSTYNTGYTITTASNNRVTVSATGQIDPLTPISVTR